MNGGSEWVGTREHGGFFEIRGVLPVTISG